MLICMSFRSYLSIISGCCLFICLFPKNGIGHTRLCNFLIPKGTINYIIRLQKYYKKMEYTRL